MRGSPVKEWIIFSVLWLLLLIPVVKLTGSRKHPHPPPVQQARTADSLRTVEAAAVLRYTGSPVALRILQQEKIRCEIANPPPGGTECRLSLQLEENGVELNLQAEWPDDQEHALEIELIIDRLDEKKAHLWAQQILDEVVLFDWQ